MVQWGRHWQRLISGSFTIVRSVSDGIQVPCRGALHSDWLSGLRRLAVWSGTYSDQPAGIDCRLAGAECGHRSSPAWRSRLVDTVGDAVSGVSEMTGPVQGGVPSNAVWCAASIVRVRRWDSRSRSLRSSTTPVVWMCDGSDLRDRPATATVKPPSTRVGKRCRIAAERDGRKTLSIGNERPIEVLGSK